MRGLRFGCFVIFGRVEILHFKFAGCLGQSNRGSACCKAIPSLFALARRLTEYLLGKVKQLLLLFSNEGFRLAFLPSPVVLPLHLTIILQVLLNVLGQVLQLVVPAATLVHIYLNIADLPPLLLNVLYSPGTIRSSPLACTIDRDHPPHVLQQ